MKKNLFFLFSFAMSLQLTAQVLPDKVLVGVPDYIANPKGSPNGIREGESWQQWCERQIKNGNLNRKKIVSYWEVYSDRDNNAVYSASDNSNQCGTVSFAKKMRVADIKNGRALCYTSSVGILPEIDKSNSKVVGWIPIENLLLYQQAPKSRNQIELKAVVVQDPQKSKVKENPQFYKAPSLNADKTHHRANDLDMLYIMKSVQSGSHTFYLLANSRSNMDLGHLQGWLSDAEVMEWDQRLTLEPVYSNAAVTEYQRSSIRPQTFVEKQNAVAFLTTGKGSLPIFDYVNFSTQRMDKNKIRQPILARTDNDKIFRTASIMFTSEREEKMVYETQEKTEETKQKISHINVIFVIDVTNSMEKYKDALTEALSKVVSKSYFGKDVNVGCVCYRDYKDHEKFGEKKGGLEVKTLTDDIGSITSFLNDIEVSSIAESSYEGMFDGIEVALNSSRMGYEKGHSNFIILIGDAANYRQHKGKKWQTVAEEIAERMCELNINFLAYQIHNNGKDAYNDFKREIGKIQHDLTIAYNAKSNSGDNYQYELIGDRTYGLRMAGSKKTSDVPVYSEYIFLNDNQTFPASDMGRLIEKKLDDFHDWVQKQIENLNKSYGGLDADKGNIEGMRAFLAKNGWTQEQIEARFSTNKSLRVLTYAPLKVEGKQKMLYDYVLLFSQNELNTLIHELDKINTNSVIKESKAFQDAIIAMGQAMIGNFDVESSGSMNMDELMRQIYGVPIELKTCGNFRIDQITTMDKAKLDKYIADFKTKISGLKKIMSSSYDGRVKKNNDYFYWIPLNDMPGFCSETN